MNLSFAPATRALWQAVISAFWAALPQAVHGHSRCPGHIPAEIA